MTEREMKVFKLMPMLVFMVSLASIMVACGDDDDDDDDDDSVDDDDSDDDDDDTSDDDDDDDSNDDPLALLGSGNHIGYIQGFEETIPENEAAIALRWEEAIDAGMSIGRIQIDWTELEPTPGVFDEVVLDEALESLTDRGLKPMLTLSTIDSEELTFPEDLMEEDHQSLVGGMDLDDPAVIARFDALAAWLVPRFKAAGGWLITVGNEVDIRSEDYPEDANHIVGFVSGAVDAIHSIDPQMPVTVTLTASAASDKPQFTSSLMELLDVACFNFYCQDSMGIVLDASSVSPGIDALLDASGDLPLVIQELGCPAGYEDEVSTIQGTLEKQKAFYEAVWEKLSETEQFRVAVVFQLLDWSPELTDYYLEWLDGMPQWFIDRFEESLRTMGLCRWEDGSELPSWDAFINGLEMFAA